MKALRILLPAAVVVFLFFLVSGNYNTLQQQSEYVTASWAQVLNQYQRRADLVPALVNVVRGYAAHEKSVFEDIARARTQLDTANIASTQINDNAALARFSEAQRQMSSALARLLMVAENYPRLRADTVFQDLQFQLEGTENRIAFARQRYIDWVAAYNVTVRSFPSNLTAMAFGYQIRSNFSVGDERAISVPPKASIE